MTNDDLFLALVVLLVTFLLVVGMGGKAKDDVWAGSTSAPVVFQP